MPLFRYINIFKELNYNIKVINSLSSFCYKFFEKITITINLLNLNFPLFQMLLKIPAQI
jgi:hypothetical protein